MLELRDDAAGLRASVSGESGGELRSVRVRRGERWFELIYAGDPSWRGGAPWLFPAVGRTKGGAMPIHGFVMDRPWESAGPAAFRIGSDASTRTVYPFDFTLTVEYALEAGAVIARATVEAAAANAEAMPFCLGNHLTLALPSGAVVRSPGREILALRPDGFLSGTTRPAGLAGGARLEERPELRDLVVAGFTAEECWTELRGADGFGVRVELRCDAPADALRFVYWSDGKRFFCVEPWLGEPDSLNSGRALTRLAPGATFRWEMRVRPDAR